MKSIIPKIYRMLVGGTLLAMLSLIVSSCGKHHDEPEPDRRGKCSRVTIVYAINRSSLAGDFVDDSNEMLRAMDHVGDDQCLLVYRTDSKTSTGLYEASWENGKWSWKLYKEYPRTVTATAPERMKEVIADAVEYCPAAQHSLFFWGHGSSWSPTFSSHQVYSDDDVAHEPMAHAFGGEYGGDVGDRTYLDYIDLTDLANSLPDNTFDFIWFDSCYMSSVEVAYELRNKCKWFVGYPTEVWQDGLNYDVILPYVMKSQPELIPAAKAFFESYDKNGEPVTVSVMDMSKIEPVATEMKALISEYPVSDTNMVGNYGRAGYNYYDLLQLMERRCGKEAVEPLRQQLFKFIVYHAVSARDFNRREWQYLPLCGISSHNFQDNNTATERFYKTLAWHNRVY